MYRRTSLSILSAVFLLANVAAGEPPYGGEDSRRYAAELWQALMARGLVGKAGIHSKPYRGQHPHGAVLDTIEGPLTVGDRTDVVIIKRNYGGKDVSVSAVYNDPDKWLRSVTVMYRRESGYDDENGNWFWARFTPDGEVERNGNGVYLAGRVAKGSRKGCIACHQAAPGSDLVFNNDRYR